MSLVEHAKKEFLRNGYIPLDSKTLIQEDGPNKWIQENVLELLEVFSKQGHSGMSAPYCINLFKKLANYDIISPINSQEEFDFQDVTDDTWQSRVISSVFLDEKKKAYYLDAIVWQGEDQYDTWTGTVEGIMSRQCVKYPFMPKSFYVDVVTVPFTGNPETEDYYEDDNKNKYVYKIKDRKQLEEVAEYYDTNF